MTKDEFEAAFTLTIEMIPTLIVAFCCAWVLIGMLVEISKAFLRWAISSTLKDRK